ncbi:MAG: type II toxin-antitoxin system VapC family toxin [Chromatiales bacterium]
MIAIDTNVLLRYLLDDEPEQSNLAAKLITGKRKVLITDVVLVETLWTLRGKKYQLSKPVLAAVVDALFQEPNILFEENQVVWQALNDYRQAKKAKGKEADFADALIVNKAKFLANNKRQKLEAVYTFDVAAQVLPGTKPLKS